MSKNLWFAFYLSIAIGVLLGLVIRTGTLIFNIGLFPNPINQAILLFHLSGAYSLYFTIIAIIAIIGAIALVIYKTGKSLAYAGENMLYVMCLGFFGAVIFVAGLISVFSVVGLALLLIGVVIAYRREKEPPGSERERK